MLLVIKKCSIISQYCCHAFSLPGAPKLLPHTRPWLQSLQKTSTCTASLVFVFFIQPMNSALSSTPTLHTVCCNFKKDAALSNFTWTWQHEQPPNKRTSLERLPAQVNIMGGPRAPPNGRKPEVPVKTWNLRKDATFLQSDIAHRAELRIVCCLNYCVNCQTNPLISSFWFIVARHFFFIEQAIISEGPTNGPWWQKMKSHCECSGSTKPSQKYCFNQPCLCYWTGNCELLFDKMWHVLT